MRPELLSELADLFAAESECTVAAARTLPDHLREHVPVWSQDDADYLYRTSMVIDGLAHSAAIEFVLEDLWDFDELEAAS